MSKDLTSFLKKLEGKRKKIANSYEFFNDVERLLLNKDKTFQWDSGEDVLKGKWEEDGNPPFDQLVLYVDGAKERLFGDIGSSPIAGVDYYAISYQLENSGLKITRVYSLK